jgi:hypothetical protein
MTSATWGIFIGMGLMFGTSLYRYLHQPPLLVERSDSAKQRIQDSLRDRYGL